ncbi:MAG: hypothetical protein M1444_01845 [Patescibacteria group bacterium]|nr:hypothetical protein [Patescibacteria group bacterium]
MAIERASSSLRGIRDRLLGSRLQRPVTELVVVEKKPKRKQDAYQYADLSRRINEAFGAELSDDTPTELLTRYFVYGFRGNTLAQAIVAEKSARLWKPVVESGLSIREMSMLTRALHSLDRNRVHLPTVGSIRAMQEVDLVFRFRLGPIGHRVLQDSLRRSETNA